MDLDSQISESIARLDPEGLGGRYREQGGLIVIDDFVPGDLLGALVDRANALVPDVHRNFVPGQKQGGSISRHTLDRIDAPFGALYRSRALREFLDALADDTLLDCRPGDPHSYALYYYTEPGDYIGWHFDTSFYRGKRYTMLIGLVDNDSCRLECDLHKRDDARETERILVAIPSGTAVFFDGDAIWHRVTPLAEDDSKRIVLTFEFVTNASMNPWRRLVSDVKDAVAYFGFRDVFLGPKSPQTS